MKYHNITYPIIQTLLLYLYDFLKIFPYYNHVMNEFKTSTHASDYAYMFALSYAT